jgi:hypothetical protein
LQPSLDKNQVKKVLKLPDQGSGKQHAKVAHLVEHDLAKVGVAGSSPVFRSKTPSSFGGGIFFE